MASALIDAAVTTLMHDRLRVLFDALVAKQALGGYAGSEAGQVGQPPRPARPARIVDVPTANVERQVRELARRALGLLEGGARAPVAAGAPRARSAAPNAPDLGTSKFAYLGSAAIDWPAFSDLYHRRRHWISQVLRGGTPDPAMSLMMSPAVDVALATIDATSAAEDRAFAMGMLGAVAAETVVTPLLRGDPERRRIESAIRAHVFGNLSTEDFFAFWPAVGDIPDGLLQGYLRGLATAGGPLATPRPRGFSDFETTFQTGAALDRGVLRQSYRVFRHGNTSWGFGQWLAWLLFYTVPVGLVLPIAAAIDSDRWQAKWLFRPGSPADPKDDAWSQLILLSTSLSWIGPFVTAAWLGGDLPEMAGDFLHAGIGVFLDLIGLGCLIGDATSTTAWPWAARWVPIIALGVSRAIYAFRALATDSPPAGAFLWTQTFPLWATAANVLVALLANAKTDDGSPGNDSKGWRIGILVGWAGVLLVGQLITAGILSGKSLLSAITGGVRNAFPPLDALTQADPPWATAALLDESTLWSNVAAPTLGTLRYPPGSGRTLLRLWWTGPGELQIRHAGHRFWFRIGDGGTPQELALPPVAFTPRELAQWLSAKVTGRPAGTPGAAGGLLAEPFLDDTSLEAAHRLPWPEVVGDSGAAFLKVGRDRDHAYPLVHGSRDRLATPHGRNGPAASVAEGWPVAPGPGLAGADGTGVGLAAELGVLLSLGAASRLDTAPPVPTPVAQVFRRWNLDARRVNEWRMLVEGGARSEKRPVAPPAPVAATVAAPVPPPATETVPADPAQPAGAGASPAVMVGSEALCNQLGWLPVFRAWSRIAGDPEQDAVSDQPAAYNPRVRSDDGRWVQPTNRQLSEAVRYLLDLPP